MMNFLIILSLLSFSLFAKTIYVVSSKQIQTSEHELKDFFSAKSDYIDGSKFKRISNEEALESLANLAFNINEKKLSKKWIKQNFRKGTPFPITLKDDTQTIKWIKSHPKTIGFITKKPLSLPIIYIFND